MKNYIKIRKCLSYNRLWTSIVGVRGKGKTFQVKKLCVNSFLTKGNKFIWIRRFEKEVKKCKDKLFNDINNKWLQDINGYVTCEGRTFYYITEINNKKIKEECGQIIHISEAQSLKSAFLEDVKYIIYDEFIIEDTIHHYYSDEVDSVLSIINSADRDRDFVRVFLMANTVTQYNPFFEYFNVKGLNKNQEYYPNFNKEILVYYDSTPLEDNKKTKLQILTEGKKANRYIYNGDFIKDENTFFVSAKPYYSRYQFTLILNNCYYGVWYSYSEMKWWISSKWDKNFKTIIAATGKDLRPNTLVLKTSLHLKYLKKAYSQGIIFYENVKVFKKCEELLKIINLY